MRYMHFTEELQDTYDVVILIKESAIRKGDLERYYIEPLKEAGVTEDNILVMSLWTNKDGKMPAKEAKAYLNTLYASLKQFEPKVFLVADSTYFKFLTGAKKPGDHYFSPLFVKHNPKYSHILCVLTVPYTLVYYDPKKLDTIYGSLRLVKEFLEQGTSVTQDLAQYRVKRAPMEYLKECIKLPAVTCDIETSDLHWNRGKILTISFGKSAKDAIAFPMNQENKRLVRDFFEYYTGKVIYHNASFDVTFLCAHIFMEHSTDYAGMYYGLEVLTKNIEDTMLMTYCCTNSCTGNELSLKAQAAEYTGKYAIEEIENLESLPEETVLDYNAVDTMATYYLYDKYEPMLKKEEQEDIYKNIFIKSIKVICAMQLVGLPLDPDKVVIAKQELINEIENSRAIIAKHPMTKQAEHIIQKAYVTKRNQELKVKRLTIDDAKHITFNLNSGNHLRVLLYEILKLPVLQQTDTGLPSTKGKLLKGFTNSIKDQSQSELIGAIYNYGRANKILTTFISAFEEKSIVKSDGNTYLTGNFKLGGTVSSRLSSNSPNLQNLPSTGTIYAKIIKQCVVAPKDWLFVGADFSSLEDRIFALISKDPQRLKIYTENYDGHCLRALTYFKDQMPDIELAEESEDCYEITTPNGVEYLKSSSLVQLEDGSQVTLKDYLQNKETSHVTS